MQEVWVYVSSADLEVLGPLVDDVGKEKVLVEIFGFDDKKLIESYKGDVDLDGELAEDGWYRYKVCEHISRMGKRVTGVRYMGIERSDKKWLAGNMASEEVRMYARGDASLVDELRSLKGC